MLTSSLYKNLLDGLQNVTASVHSCTLHLSWSRHRMTYLLYPMTTSWRAECYSTNDALWGPAALQTIAQLIFVDRHSGYSISRCLLPAVLVYIFTSLWTAQTIIRHQRSTALRLVTHCVIQASIILFHVQSKQWPKLSWSAHVLHANSAWESAAPYSGSFRVGVGWLCLQEELKGRSGSAVSNLAFL